MSIAAMKFVQIFFVVSRLTSSVGRTARKFSAFLPPISSKRNSTAFDDIKVFDEETELSIIGSANFETMSSKPITLMSFGISSDIPRSSIQTFIASKSEKHMTAP